MKLNFLKQVLLAAVVAVAFSGQGVAQHTVTSTTLSAALNKTDTIFNVASAPSGTAAGWLAFVNGEAMRISAVSGNTLTVVRGTDGTQVQSHTSGDTIYIDQAFYFGLQGTEPQGSCTAATDQRSDPMIDLATGDLYDCVSSLWVKIKGASGIVPNVQPSSGVELANSLWAASNSVVFEGATADASEGTITPQDFAADRAITLLDAAGGLNVGYVTEVILCGDLPNNTTHYTSPVSGFGAGPIYNGGATYAQAEQDWDLAGVGCAAEDSTTEATADEVMFANNAFKVLGMYCVVSGSGSNGVTINLRSATANLTPDITVTIPTTETTAVASTVTTTDVAAGATFAARAISTEDLSAQDFWCSAKILVVP